MNWLIVCFGTNLKASERKELQNTSLDMWYWEWFLLPCIRSFIHSFIDTFIHSFIHSFVHTIIMTPK